MAKIVNQRPSPPWYGGLVSAVNFLAAGWLLAYTLVPVPPIQSLGAWNYLVVAAAIPVQAVLVKRWRGDPYVRPEATTPKRDRTG